MHTEAVEQQYRSAEAAKIQYGEAFDRLNQVATRNPGLFALRVALIGVLGWIYLGFLVMLALGSILLTRGSPFFLIVGGYLLVAIVQSLRAPKAPAPEGIELKRDSFRRLYQELDELAARFGTEPIDCVRICYRAYAAATERPRFGLFGGFRRQMVVGLPLLLALDDDEVRSILCHEMGHFSGKHGQICHRLYRVQAAWRELRERKLHQRRSVTTGLIVPFADWYLKVLSAHDDVLRRQQEIEADTRAREVCGRAAGMALLRAQVLYAKLDALYIGIYELPKTEGEPPADFCQRLAAALSEPIEVSKIDRGIRFALSEESLPTNAHPSLRQRMVFHGVDPDTEINLSDLNRLPDRVAADNYLGSQRSQVFDELNKIWLSDGRDWWLKTHQEYADMSEELRKVREAPKSNPDHYLQEAYLVGEVEGLEAAIAIYLEAYQLWPEDPNVLLRYGLTMLALQHEAGVDMVERAMALDPQLMALGCERLSDYYRAIGDRARYAEAKTRQEKVAVAQQISKNESHYHFQDDVYVPHRMTEAQIMEAAASVADIKGLKELYIVRKVLQKSGMGETLIVVAVPDAKHFRWRLSSEKPEAVIQHKVAGTLALPEASVIYGRKRDSSLVMLVKQVPGALIPLHGSKG